MTRKTATATAPRQAPARATGPGRPKDLAKRASILDAARQLFLEQGYQGVSMDQIAAAAGVSKLTVYSHFGDKESLFVEAIAAQCRQAIPDDLFIHPPEGPLREQLRAIGRAFFALVTSEEAISLQRMMNTPGSVENGLREMFWEAGPKRLQSTFARFLQERVDEGRLRIDDVALASSQFFCLLKGVLHPMMTCGLRVSADPDEVERHIDATVDFFLRAHGH